MNAKNVIVIILAMLFLLPMDVNAQATNSIKRLDTISDEALQMAKTYRYEEAAKFLNLFEEEFMELTEKGHLFTMDELRIITVSHAEAKEAITNSELDQKERLYRVTQFRLVMDAVMSTYQPMWTELEAPIMTIFSGMKIAAQNGDNENFIENLESFLTLYNVIYPSLKIDVTPEKIQQLNARVNYLNQYPEAITAASNQEELYALENDLRKIFDGMTDDETDPSLWWVIISTGSIIIMTLSYVGWRKYKADKQRRLNRLKERKN